MMLLKARGPLSPVCFLLFSAQVVSAPQPVNLSASLANLSVPPGGTAQLQVFLATPKALVSGGAVIDLDPSIFDNIAAADIYSATGDQIGIANIQGRHVDIEFRSQTGGVGRLPALPVLSLTVPVLSTAARGVTSSFTLKPGTVNWTDTDGVQYAPGISSGTLTVGGSLSVKAIAIEGGLLPAGSTVRIDGTGFSSSTTVQIDGVAIASTLFASPQQLNVTLASAADLTFRRVVLQNPPEAALAIFPVLHGNFAQRPLTGSLSTIQPIFPLQLYQAVDAGGFLSGDTGLALQNASGNPVDVTIQSVSPGGMNSRNTVTVPAGGSYLQPVSSLGAASSQSALVILPGAPIRMALTGSTAFNVVTPQLPPASQIFAYFSGTSQIADSLAWNWTPGASLPAAYTLAVLASPAATPFTVSVSTDSGSIGSGGQWLSASPLQGSACLAPSSSVPVSCPASGSVTVRATPAGLPAGIYSGSVTILPQGGNAQPQVITATLRVFAQPTLFTDQPSLALQTSAVLPVSAVVHLTSSADPLPFTIAVSTRSGQNWLSATADSGTTPASITVSANPAALTASADTGTVVVTGPSNSLSIPVAYSLVAPVPRMIAPLPSSLQFTVSLGQTAILSQMIGVYPTFDPFTVAAQTGNGGNWLSAVVRNGPGVPTGVVSVDPTGLPAGTYSGSVTVVSASASAPATVPITLTIWSGSPPPVSTDVPSVSLSAAHGSTAKQTLAVSTGNLPLPFSASASTSDGAGWLRAVVPVTDFTNPQELPKTPGTVLITADATSLAPGTYTGTVTITAPAGSSSSGSVAVTFTVTSAPQPLPQPGAVPLVTSVLNAASQQPGAISPGEMITVLGQNLGPVTPGGFALGSDGKVSTNLGGAQVLFDGVPAPLLYASATQINAIAPYAVNGISNITIQYNGVSIAAGGYVVSDSTPGIFTVTGGGGGAAAVLNQDSSFNTVANPAARGSVVQIFATGEGLTSPPGVTGELSAANPKYPQLPVSATIGGADAPILYAGSAPDAVSGLFQVNVSVPQNIPPGSSVPIVVTVGNVSSQRNVTLAVKE